MSPLNPRLYDAMVRRFGDGGVQIANEGEAMQWRLVVAEGRKRREVLYPGEEYYARCPFCKDDRPRMYLNHRFGVWDAETNSTNLWLSQCFRQQCLDNADNREALYERLHAMGSRGVAPVAEVKPGRMRDLTKSMQWPGRVRRIDALARETPNHPAVRYLRDRNFDLEMLGRVWSVAYCERSMYPLATDRIIIPVFWGKRLVGWQARFIGNSLNGMSLKDAGLPKYWTSPGYRKGFLPYNFLRAVQHSTVVLVEGPTDGWRMGVQSIPLFGKTMGYHARDRLLAEMEKRHSPEVATIVILLDPEGDPKAKEHHIDKLYKQLSTYGAAVRVVPVWLPLGVDPADCERAWLRDYIREAAAKLGVTVDFSRPK